jgi:SWI/SNF-related matrix-associated actin-dependent regulator of chromatin subfamily A-like protein 1
MPVLRTLSLSPGKKPGTATAAFMYDPELIAVVKQIPGREWDKTRRVWTIPALPESIAMLRDRLPKNTVLHIAPALEADVAARAGAIQSALAAREKGDSGIAFDYRTEPYAHQRAGLEFLASLGGGALLWEMGLGKTKTAIDYAEWLDKGTGALRILVACPNTVKRNWTNEIEKHAGHSGYIVPDGTIKQRVKQYATRRYTIVNCEQLSFAESAAALAAISWDLVIVDESTRFKTPSSSRTKALHKIRSAHRVILTGTPITGKPEDAWAQMHFIEPGMLGSWWGFQDRYLDKNPWTKAIEGVKPGMDLVLSRVIGTRSYRLRKEEVLDLPPKVYEDRLVEMDGEQKRAYETMKHDLRMTVGDNVVEAWNILTQLLRLTQVTAGLLGAGDRYSWLTGNENAKIKALDELLDDLGPDEPVVIFGMYQRELEHLALRYGKSGDDHGAGLIYGPTPERRRAEYIDAFQAGRLKRLFVQQHTGGIGINLTAAKYAVYFTRGWSLEDWLQSQDRLHRIGQTGTVTIITLTAKGTIDEDIAAALGQKQNIADALTGDSARALARKILGEK